MCLQTDIFQFYNTPTFSAMRLDENPSTGQYEKEDKNAEGFQISQFYRLFSSDIMAVKRLRCHYFVFTLLSKEKRAFSRHSSVFFILCSVLFFSFNFLANEAGSGQVGP